MLTEPIRLFCKCSILKLCFLGFAIILYVYKCLYVNGKHYAIQLIEVDITNRKNWNNINVKYIMFAIHSHNISLKLHIKGGTSSNRMKCKLLWRYSNTKLNWPLKIFSCTLSQYVNFANKTPRSQNVVLHKSGAE